MKLPEMSVRRPVLVTMFFIGLTILGLMSFYLLPIDTMPDLEVPNVIVITQYPGASATDVEQSVTKLMENTLATVNNLDEIKSTTLEEYSIISLKFTWGTNMDTALVDARDKISFIETYLPPDVKDSVFLRIDMSMYPVMIYAVNAQQNYNNLFDILDNQVSPALKRLPGVALTQVIGAPQREIRVNLNLDRLAAYKISPSKVVQAIRYENLNIPAGSIKFGKTDYVLRVPGEFKSIREMDNVVVDIRNGVPIYLRDLARVEDTFKESERVVRIDGLNGTILMIQKASGSNSVKVAKAIKKGMEQITKLVPADVKFVELMDTSEFVVQSITNLYDIVLYAGIFVLLVVLVFLRNIRASIIIALTIPFSLIVSFIFLYAMNYSINTMSLSSLAIAIGLVVDDAIVVLENIFRHRYKGLPPRQAAVFGASEVGLAVTASTLTILAILLPVVFVPGITGVMFKQFALVTALVIGMSLLVSLTITPMLASKLLTRLPDPNAQPANILDKGFRVTETWLHRLEDWYADLLGWALAHKKTVILGGIGIFIFSLMLAPLISTEFFPQVDQGFLNGVFELPTGTRIEETDKIMKKLEAVLTKEVPERKMMFARAGKSENGMGIAFGNQEDINIIALGARLVPKTQRSRSQFDIAHSLNESVSKIPGIENIDFTLHDPFAEIMTGGGKAIQIEVYGRDLDKSYPLAQKIEEIVRKTPGTIDTSISMKMGKPELWVQVDRDKASRLGLPFALIGSTVKTSFYGEIASRYRDKGNEYDIFVNLDPRYRQRVEDVQSLKIPVGLSLPISIPGLESGAVSLNNLARVVPATGPLSIEHKNQERVIKVGSSLYKRPLSDVVADLKKELAKLPVPDGISVVFGGYAEQQKESFTLLGIAFILGMILVYMVMASQFESLIHPFVILFSVPFAITGVIWGFLLSGFSFGLIAFVGMIMLIGIVVKNGIVMIDYTNILRSRGKDIESALQEACKIRLRPVLMTSLTAILAMLPMIFAKGEGTEIWAPMGVTVACGLSISLLVTLVFVPTMYSVLERKTELKGYEERVTGQIGADLDK
jgi:HAE1 family hydrophobic/amphiphilic exporter-1